MTAQGLTLCCAKSGRATTGTHGATTTQWNRGFEPGDRRCRDYREASGTIETRPTDKALFLFNQDTKKPRLDDGAAGMYDGTGRVMPVAMAEAVVHEGALADAGGVIDIKRRR